MEEKTTVRDESSSSVIWEQLEPFVRSKVQELVQEMLEQEMTEFLGRQRYERREGEEAGYRNGYGKPRRLAMQGGTITVRRPRVRDLDEEFVSRVLPFFARHTREVGAMLPELYLHGLSLGDFEVAMRGLLGDAAPLSSSSIDRLRLKWQREFEEWRSRRLDGREPVYVWADGIYVKAGLEKEKAALLVVIGAMKDGTKEVLTIMPGFRESTESWLEVLRDLRIAVFVPLASSPPMAQLEFGPLSTRSGPPPQLSDAGITRSSMSSTGYPSRSSERRRNC